MILCFGAVSERPCVAVMGCVIYAMEHQVGNYHLSLPENGLLKIRYD